MPSSPPRSLLVVPILTLAACPQHGPTTPPTPPPPARLTAQDVTELVRDIPKDIRSPRARSDVMLFKLRPRPARPEGPPEPCNEPLTDPATIRTILPTPDFGELFASGSNGSLLRRVERAWEPVPLPGGTPPIVALVGFVAATSPLELVVDVGDDRAELWTLTLEGTTVSRAGPTDMSGPEYLGEIAFLRGHDTPRCLDGEGSCLLPVQLNTKEIVVKLRSQWSSTPSDFGVIVGPGVILSDISWSEANGGAIYVAASGPTCLSFTPPSP